MKDKVELPADIVPNTDEPVDPSVQIVNDRIEAFMREQSGVQLAVECAKIEAVHDLTRAVHTLRDVLETALDRATPDAIVSTTRQVQKMLANLADSDARRHVKATVEECFGKDEVQS